MVLGFLQCPLEDLEVYVVGSLRACSCVQGAPVGLGTLEDLELHVFCRCLACKVVSGIHVGPCPHQVREVPASCRKSAKHFSKHIRCHLNIWALD